MKKTILLALLGAASFCAPAQAQVTFDMAKLSCADYNAMDPIAAQTTAAWMSGWFNQRLGNTVINLEGYRRNVANVGGWCVANPSANIMAGLQAAMDNAQTQQGGPTAINAAQITCGQFLKTKGEEHLLVASWMGGWFMSTKNLTNVDPRYTRRNSEKIVAYCKGHKGESLMAAVKEIWR
ncbi:HdeA/HdeB family chaperone [Enterovirga sp.]|uniref:HdeA/HdeB family chaperone n=1 Tax=Enterovirga sp. TaxID=2026350 RepID=UPI002C470580|nr:HdeA/HdeB family chaperone [Enterovirga sp.]HMO27870.1 HdeA/HdeB family chaperone [Enterovirga sp.]